MNMFKALVSSIRLAIEVLSGKQRDDVLVEQVKIAVDKGMTVLLDVDQTVYDKGVWDVAFLNSLVEAGIEIVFATHGATTDKGTCPVAYSEYTDEKGEYIDTTHAMVDMVCDDGSIYKDIVIADNGMPVLKKVVPEGYILIDNMAEHYDDSENVLYREFRLQQKEV